MHEQHAARVELFVSNTQIIKKSFKWKNVMMHRLAALLYAAEKKQADGEAIRQSHELIKQNTNLFSAFRGNSAISIATLLSLTTDQEKKLEDTLLIYDLMIKKSNFVRPIFWLSPPIRLQLTRRLSNSSIRSNEPNHFMIT
ncbi:DUF4003 family protein [Paenibacillus sp. BIC5C1]|uniref:DUF4003 family protein n=1 Tax=Paenibacillus sp. BIC5C1 TaxID=3078263 RepID=UPI0028EB34CC|nr:DUF4003 family protein [Paenibacillus sp. BIC5C1]